MKIVLNKTKAPVFASNSKFLSTRGRTVTTSGTMAQPKEKCIDLSIVSDKFTEEVLTNILSKACDNGEEVRLINWNFDEGFAKGDYYTSSINKGSVNGIIDDSLGQQRVQVNFIVKAMPKNLGRRKTLRSTDFFRNEITFYTEVAPRFEEFLAGKGQSNFLRIPRHLASLTDGENDFLALEDATCLGFGPASRQNCLNWAECTVILKMMAKFHATSFAYKDQRKQEFAEIGGRLEEAIFSRNCWNWYKNYLKSLLKVAKHALATEYPGSKAEKYFNSYKSSILYDKCIELCSRKDAPTSVVCEGDCWAPNFLVRDVGQNLKEALMLDFQLSRCASPITDLAFFVYSCTLKSFRDQYFDEILKMYHSELCSAITLLGSDPENIYPWDLFMKEVKEQFIFGIVAALEIIPLSLKEVPASFDLDSVFKSNEAVDLAEVAEFVNIETASGRQRLADVIVHAVDNGFLPHAD